ncbi:MAG: hypothetical protein QGF90_07045 [Gammaproteobacteria bacterium]|nr:hypothetical protein [Gammaproteobacteria bacterium]
MMIKLIRTLSLVALCWTFVVTNANAQAHEIDELLASEFPLYNGQFMAVDTTAATLTTSTTVWVCLKGTPWCLQQDDYDPQNGNTRIVFLVDIASSSNPGDLEIVLDFGLPTESQRVNLHETICPTTLCPTPLYIISGDSNSAGAPGSTGIDDWSTSYAYFMSLPWVAKTAVGSRQMFNGPVISLYDQMVDDLDNEDYQDVEFMLITAFTNDLKSKYEATSADELPGEAIDQAILAELKYEWEVIATLLQINGVTPVIANQHGLRQAIDLWGYPEGSPAIWSTSNIYARVEWLGDNLNTWLSDEQHDWVVADVALAVNDGQGGIKGQYHCDTGIPFCGPHWNTLASSTVVWQTFNAALQEANTQ